MTNYKAYDTIGYKLKESNRKGERNMKKKYFYGQEISEYGTKNGYVDYRTLSKVVGDAILNNRVIGISSTLDEWELYNGIDYNAETNQHIEIYQYYIVSDRGAEFLCNHTNEIVYYNAELDIYLWAITHCGTAWNYVLTDIPIPEQY